jgi:K+-transporting ATPase ATPase C chain
MRRQLVTAFLVTVVLTVLLGIVYPLVVTGVAQVVFPHQAGGSLVKVGGKVVGSSLIGQRFSDAQGNPLPQYFQPRPSAAGTNGYDPTASGASNLGPSNPALLKAIADRVAAYRQFNGLSADASVPVDAVTASGSGLDPDISEANALEQAARVAGARHLAVAAVVSVVHRHANGRPWGVLGEGTVNVLDLNLALDRNG